MFNVEYTGRYHTVTCLDVMIHYPQDRVDGMIQHLGLLAEERLIISFAPKNLAYSILKRIGELFPGPSKVRGPVFWEIMQRFLSARV